MCLNANPDLFQESHKDLFVEINRLSLSIHQIREEAKRFFQNNFTTDFKALLLKSYLNSSINIVEDIAFLLKRSRRSSLEGMARMFFESYAEYYQIASKYCFDTEIEKEINYVYFREIDNQRCAYERIKKSAASSDLDDVKGSLKQDIKLLIQKRFANELSGLKEETDDAFLESIKVVLQRIKNNSALIDNKRISLEKQSRLVMTAINANPIWGPSGCSGNELIYGILSDSIHAHLSTTIWHSQENGVFNTNTFDPTTTSLVALLILSLDHMRDLLVGISITSEEYITRV